MSRELEALSIADAGASTREIHGRQSFVNEYQDVEELLANPLSFAAQLGAEESKSSIGSGIFNLANTICGAAITGLPFVAAEGGVIPYVMFLTFSAACGYTSLKMLVDCCNYLPPGAAMDYQAVGVRALGPPGRTMTALATCLSTFAALTAYLVLIGTSAPVLARQLNLNIGPKVLQIVFCIVLILPLCLLKNISALAPSSLFAMLVFGLMALASLIAFMSGDDFYSPGAPSGDIQWFPTTFGVKEMGSFSTIIMAFNCQYAMFPICNNLRGGGQEDKNKVCAGGILSSYSIYIGIALFSVFTYRENTKDMILLNFRHCTEGCANETILAAGSECPTEDFEWNCEDKNGSVKILSVLFLIAVLMGYPCVHFALRKAQIALVLGLDAPFTWPLHIGIAVANIVATLGIAMVIGPNVSFVFAWSGAVAGPLISFILPGLFYYKILGQAGVPVADPRRSSALAVLCYGSAVCCLCVILNLLKYV